MRPCCAHSDAPTSALPDLLAGVGGAPWLGNGLPAPPVCAAVRRAQNRGDGTSIAGPADLWHGLPPTPAADRVFYFAWLDSPSCRAPSAKKDVTPVN